MLILDGVKIPHKSDHFTFPPNLMRLIIRDTELRGSIGIENQTTLKVLEVTRVKLCADRNELHLHLPRTLEELTVTKSNFKESSLLFNCLTLLRKLSFTEVNFPADPNHLIIPKSLHRISLTDCCMNCIFFKVGDFDNLQEVIIENPQHKNISFGSKSKSFRHKWSF